MKEIENIFLIQGLLCSFVIVTMGFIYSFGNKDLIKDHVAFVLCVAIYCFICFIIADVANHERSVEEINTYKEYYKDTENMIDAIWELEPETFNKIDKTKYDTARNKVYKLIHVGN